MNQAAMKTIGGALFWAGLIAAFFACTDEPAPWAWIIGAAALAAFLITLGVVCMKKGER